MTPLEPESLFTTVLGARKSVALLLALGSGLLDAIHDEAVPSDVLAARLGLHPAAVSIVLGLLRRLGRVEPAASGHTLAAATRSALAGPSGPMLRLEARLFLAMPEGRAWLDALQGRAFADTTAWISDPDTLALYPEAMRRANAEFALRTLRWLRPMPERGLVLDVGGGTGTFGVPLLRHFRGLRWVVADLPGLEHVATALAEREHARERCEFVACDVRDGLPRETRRFVVVLLSQILHLIGPEPRARLVRDAVERLAPGGRLAVLDFFPDSSGDGPIEPWLMAMDWLRYGTMFHEGVEQIRALLEAAGTTPPVTRPLGSGVTLVVAGRPA